MLKRITFALPAAALTLAGFAAPAQASVNPAYYYAGGQETPAAAKTTFTGNIKIANPAVDANDHSLMELTVQNMSAGYTPAWRQAVVGIGWRKQSGGNTTLFAERYRNNVWGGSVVGFGDGWVDNTGNCVDLGTDLNVVPVTWTTCSNITSTRNDVGTAKAFSWVHGGSCLGGNPGWFGYYNAVWVGCYPDTIWSTGTAPTYSFVDGRFFQAYGEVYDDDTTVSPCTDMGTGVMGSLKSAATGAYFGSVQYNGGFANMGTWAVQTNPTWYTTGAASGATGYVGGPGAC